MAGNRGSDKLSYYIESSERVRLVCRPSWSLSSGSAQECTSVDEGLESQAMDLAPLFVVPMGLGQGVPVTV